MKTDMAGGPAADGNLEERLSAVSRPNSNKPSGTTRPSPERAVAPGRRRAGLTWPRLALPVVAVARTGYWRARWVLVDSQARRHDVWAGRSG